MQGQKKISQILARSLPFVQLIHWWSESKSGIRERKSRILHLCDKHRKHLRPLRVQKSKVTIEYRRHPGGGLHNPTEMLRLAESIGTPHTRFRIHLKEKYLEKLRFLYSILDLVWFWLKEWEMIISTYTIHFKSFFCILK